MLTKIALLCILTRDVHSSKCELGRLVSVAVLESSFQILVAYVHGMSKHSRCTHCITKNTVAVFLNWFWFQHFIFMEILYPLLPLISRVLLINIPAFSKQMYRFVCKDELELWGYGAWLHGYHEGHLSFLLASHPMVGKLKSANQCFRSSWQRNDPQSIHMEVINCRVCKFWEKSLVFRKWIYHSLILTEWISPTFKTEFCEIPSRRSSNDMVYIDCPETLEVYGVLWLLLLVQTFPWELTGELHLEAIHSLAIRRRMSWWMATRQVLQEIFVSFLLYTPHVPATRPVFTLKAKMKHRGLTSQHGWASYCGRQDCSHKQ